MLADKEQEKLLHPKKMRSKYNAKRIFLGGLSWDSHAECARWIVLLDMQKKGLISCLEVKPIYKLACGLRIIPDFRYFDELVKRPNGFGTRVIEDVKGRITREWIVKCKQFEHEYKQKITIVMMQSSVVENLIAAWQSQHQEKKP